MTNGEARRARVFRLFGKQRQLRRDQGRPLDFRIDITVPMARRIVEEFHDAENDVDHILNRGKREIMTIRYAKDRADDKWTISHQGIAFDINGALRDGQHRIASVVASGKAWEYVLVTLDLPPEAAMHFDIGGKKSGIENVHGAGLCDWASKTHASMAKFMETRHRKQPIGGNALSVAELIRRLEMHKNALLFATREATGRHTHRVTTAPHLSAIAKAFYYCKPAQLPRLARFAAVLSTGLPEKKDEHAAATLRHHLEKADPNSSGQTRQRSHILTQAVIRVFMKGSVKWLRTPPANELYPLRPPMV